MNNQQFSLVVSGVSCMKCVGRLTSALKDQDPTISLMINEQKDLINLTTTLDSDTAIQIITSAGYPSSLAIKSYYETSVSNVSCQKCVNKIKNRIKDFDLLASIEVDISKQRLTVHSHLDDSRIERVLAELGYNADVIKQAPLKLKEVQLESQLNQFDTNVRAQSVQLALSGVTCARCVNTIQSALEQTSGVETVNINFANRTASIVSTHTPDELIDIIQSTGYDAKEIIDKDAADAEKIELERKEYRSKIK